MNVDEIIGSIVAKKLSNKKYGRYDVMKDFGLTEWIARKHLNSANLIITNDLKKKVANGLIELTPEMEAEIAQKETEIETLQSDINKQFEGAKIVTDTALTKGNTDLDMQVNARLLALHDSILDLPFGAEEENLPKPVIIGCKRPLFLSDIHFPYHDFKALQLAIEYGIKNHTDCIYLNGDIIDAYQQSRFNKDADSRNFQTELNMVRTFFSMLRKVFPDIPIYYKLGNHELRHELYISQNRGVLGIEEFQLEYLLHLRQYNITLVEGRQWARFGDLFVFHGHEGGSFLKGGVNAAQNTAKLLQKNAVIGHIHKTQSYLFHTPFGTCAQVNYTGCLSNINPRYVGLGNYNLGFAFAVIDENGKSNVSNIVIENNNGTYSLRIAV